MKNIISLFPSLSLLITLDVVHLFKYLLAISSFRFVDNLFMTFAQTSYCLSIISDASMFPDVLFVT